jgi:predicted transcriptional regulator
LDVKKVLIVLNKLVRKKIVVKIWNERRKAYGIRSILYFRNGFSCLLW